MKTIKVLIAASEEMHEEKIQFSNLIEALNEALEPRGIELERVKWNPDTDGSVEEFMEKAKECEMCLTLYWRDLADLSEEELTTAFQALKDGKNPQNIYVFFKEPTEDLTEALKDFKANFVAKYGHFFCKFENVDTMNLHFILQFEAFQNKKQTGNEEALVQVGAGKVTVGGKEVVDFDNIPFTALNKEYQRLHAELAEADKQLGEAKKKYLADSDNEALEEAYFAAKTKRKEISEEFEKYQVHLYDIALGFAKQAGERFSERMARAKEAFERGDVTEADRILNMEEMKREAEAELKQFQQHRDNLSLIVEEFKMKAETVMANTELSIPERFAQACEAYKEAINIAKTIHYDDAKTAPIMFDYATLLGKNNYWREAIPIYEDLVVITYRLAESGEEFHMHGLASTLNNLALQYKDFGLEDKSEKAYKEALTLYCTLAERFGEAYDADVVLVLNNLGALEGAQERYDEGSAHYSEALETIRRLMKKNPDAYEALLASTLHNMAILEKYMGQLETADAHYSEALEINRRLVKMNPEEYEPDVARTLDSIARLKVEMGHPNEAEPIYQEAITIRLRLAQANPAAHERSMAKTLEGYSMLQLNTEKYEEAEMGFEALVPIYRHMAAEYDLYESDLAEALMHLGIAQHMQEKYDQAVASYSEALTLFEELETREPGTYIEFITGIKEIIDQFVPDN